MDYSHLIQGARQYFQGHPGKTKYDDILDRSPVLFGSQPDNLPASNTSPYSSLGQLNESCIRKPYGEDKPNVIVQNSVSRCSKTTTSPFIESSTLPQLYENKYPDGQNCQRQLPDYQHLTKYYPTSPRIQHSGEPIWAQPQVNLETIKNNMAYPINNQEESYQDRLQFNNSRYLDHYSTLNQSCIRSANNLQTPTVTYQEPSRVIETDYLQNSTDSQEIPLHSGSHQPTHLSSHHHEQDFVEPRYFNPVERKSVILSHSRTNPNQLYRQPIGSNQLGHSAIQIIPHTQSPSLKSSWNSPCHESCQRQLDHPRSESIQQQPAVYHVPSQYRNTVNYNQQPSQQNVYSAFDTSNLKYSGQNCGFSTSSSHQYPSIDLTETIKEESLVNRHYLNHSTIVDAHSNNRIVYAGHSLKHEESVKSPPPPSCIGFKSKEKLYQSPAKHTEVPPDPSPTLIKEARKKTIDSKSKIKPLMVESSLPISEVKEKELENWDPIVSDQKWEEWQVSFDTEWTAFVKELTLSDNIRRVHRVTQPSPKKGKRKGAIKSEEINDLPIELGELSDEDIPLSLRRKMKVSLASGQSKGQA